jgi:hypothetical protein
LVGKFLGKWFCTPRKIESRIVFILQKEIMRMRDDGIVTNGRILV